MKIKNSNLTMMNHWKSLLGMIAILSVTYLHAQTATFTPKTIISNLGSTVTDIEIVDLDENGTIDLLVATTDGIVYWIQEDGIGGYSSSILFSIGSSLEIEVADLDNNGNLDIAVIASNNVYIYKELSGSYSLSNTISVIGGRRIELEDFNGDGAIDIVANSSSTDQIRWFANTGSASFSSQSSLSGFRAQDIVAVDLDGDGDKDVLATYPSRGLFWYQNNGSGTFVENQIASGSWQAIDLVDSDGDGDLDITGGANTETYYLENVSGSFVLRYAAPSNNSSISIVDFADLDGQGYTDFASLAVGTSELYYYESDGANGYSQYQLGAGTTIQAMTTAQFSGSAFIDIIATSALNDIIVFENNLQPQTLIAQYDFTQSNASDESGNNLNGVVFGTPTYTDDRLGNPSEAILLDGLDDYVAINHDAQFNVGLNGDFSLSAWFRTTSTASQVILDKSDGNIAKGYFLWLPVPGNNNGIVQFYLVDTNAVSVNSTHTGLNDGNWHHVAVIVDRDDAVTMYIDNEYSNASVGASNGLNPDVVEDYLIGVAGNTGNTGLNSYFEGALDDVRFYNAVITTTDISAIYAEGGWPNLSSGSTEAEITGVAFNEGSIESIDIDNVNGIVDIVIAYGGGCSGAGCFVESLTPIFNLSAGATISPASGVTQDFTNAVAYVVTAEDGITTRNWSVSVTEGQIPCEGTNLYAFDISGQVTSTLDANTNTVTIIMPAGTDLTSLTPTISHDGSITPSSGVSQDFTNPVTYTIEDFNCGGSSTWTVSVELESSIILQYDFNGDAVDVSGNGKNLTAVGTPTLITDRFGISSTAYQLNGAGDYFSADNVDVTPQATLSAWFKTSADFSAGWANFAEVAGSIGLGMGVENTVTGSMQLGAGNFISLASPGVKNDGKWHHAAITFNGTSLIFYVDGIEVSRDENYTGDISFFNNPTTFNVGYSNDGSDRFYNGSVDDIRYYGTALSAIEVEQLYKENGFPASTVSTVTLYVVNSTSGNAFYEMDLASGINDYEYGVVVEIPAGSEVSFDVTYVDGTFLNYGDAGLDGVSGSAESFIPVTTNSTGLFYVSWNADGFGYQVYEISTLGFLGSARTGDDSGWNDPDLDMNYEGSGIWNIRTNVFDGLWKVRANDTWTVANWGSFQADGNLDFFSLDIPISAGDAIISVDLINATYSVTYPIAAPGLSTYASSDSSIELFWTNVEGETGYNVFRSTDNSSYDYLGTTGVDVTNWTDAGLASNTIYYYLVESTDGASTSTSNVSLNRTFSQGLSSRFETLESYGSAGYDYGRSVAVNENDGSYYFFGEFSGEIDFQGNILNTQSQGVFLVRFDANDNVIWARSYDSFNATNNAGYAYSQVVKLDTEGNAYITGWFTGTINGVSAYEVFDGSTFVGYEENLFVSKIDPNGNHLWTKSLRTSQRSSGSDIAIDNVNNVYVVGSYNGTTAFASQSLSGNGVIILKYDSLGNEIWARGAVQSDATSAGLGLGIDLFNSNLFVVGSIYSQTDFLGTILNDAGNGDIFYAQLDLDGNLINAQSYGGSLEESAFDVTVDNAGNVYLTGYFDSGTLTIGGRTVANPTEGYNEIFLVKLTAGTTNAEWLSNYGSVGHDLAFNIATDGQNVYITGLDSKFNSSFGSITSDNGTFFLTKVQYNGTVEWVERAEGSIRGRGLTYGLGKLYVPGRFEHVANAGGTYYYSNSNSADAWIGILNTNPSAVGLVGYYTFDNGSFDDASGVGIAGSTPNGALFSTDRYGFAFSSFEPENNGTYAVFDFTGTVDFSSGAVGFGAWIRPNTFPDGQEFWDAITTIEGLGNLYVGSQGSIDFHWFDTGINNFNTISSEIRINRNENSFVFFTIDEANVYRLFINGQQSNIAIDGGTFQSEIAINREQSAGTSNVFLSSSSTSSTDNRWFNGDIDDVRIYSGEIPSSQIIADIFNSEVPGGADRLVAAYDFYLGEFSDISENFFDNGTYRDVNGNVISPLLYTGIDGDADGSIYFDNNGSFVEYFHERSINVNNNVTVNLWVYPYSLPETGRLGDVIFSDGALGRLMYAPDGRLFYHYPNNSGQFPAIYESTGSVRDIEWQMITLTIDNDDNLTIYHNGAQVISANIGDQQDNVSAVFTIGLNDYVDADLDRYLYAAIDDVSIRQRVMSSAEIAGMYGGSKGLLVYYPFDGNANDVSGNENNGIPVNGAFLTNDRFGDSGLAFGFDGVNDYINMSPLDEDLSQGLTFMAWVNMTEFKNWARVFDFSADGPSNNNILFGRNGNTDDLVYQVWQNDINVGSIIATSALTLNEWMHLAVTHDPSGNVSLYKDGQLISSGVLGLPLDLIRYTAYLGRSNWVEDEYFAGAMDEVRLYDIALTSDEIFDIYLLEAPIEATFAHYPFISNANDIGPNQYNGTLIGGATIDGQLNIGDNAQDGVLLPQSVMNGYGDFTVSTYVNFAGLHASGGVSSNSILSGANNTTANELHLFYDKNFNSWRVGIKNIFSNADFFDDQVTTNNWYHVAFTRSGGDISVYVDGVLKNRIFMTDQQIEIVNGGLVIGQEQDNLGGGGYQQDQSLHGSILNMRIYDVALSEQEIIALRDQDGPRLPEPATNVNALVIGPNAMIIRWVDNADNETRYEVYAGDLGQSTQEKFELDANSTSVLLEDFETDVSYEITVVAVNNAGSSIGSESTIIATAVQLSTPIVEVSPSQFTIDDPITITAYVDRMYPVNMLANDDRIYLHSGLVAAGSENQGGWMEAPGSQWGSDNGIGEMTNNGDGTFSITIDNPRAYYGYDGSFEVAQIGMQFRSVDGFRYGNSGYNPATNTTDIFIDLFRSENIEKVPGQFASFNGSNAINTSSPTNPAAWAIVNQFTIEHWVNFQSLPTSTDPWMSMITRGRDGIREFATGVYRNDATNGGLAFEFWLQDAANFVQIPNINDEDLLQKWNHFAVSFDGVANEVKIYWNGILVSQATTSVAYNTTLGTEEFLLVGQFLNGYLDDLRFWNYVLSPEEIRSRISVELNGSNAGLAGYWPFNETLSDGVNQYTPDITSNANHLYGAVELPGLPDLSLTVDLINGTSSSSVVDLLIGEDATVNYTIRNNANNGAVLSGTVTTGFYLSTNGTLDSFDRLLGTSTETISIADGASAVYTATLSVPSDVTPRTYWLLSVGDQDKAIDESDETNNQDLKVVSVVNLPPVGTVQNLNAPDASITTSSFTASWAAPATGGASGYYYQYQMASDADFINIIEQNTNYNNTSVNFSGLALETTYHFRVRAGSLDDTRVGNYSQITITTKGDEVNPVITLISSDVDKTDGASPITISITVFDVGGAIRVDLFKKPILAANYTKVELNDGNKTSDDTFTYTLAGSELDDQGVMLYAEAYDLAGNKSEKSETISIIKDIPPTQVETIPNIETGSLPTDYQMIAFPYVSKNVTEVFSQLGPVDPETWRLMNWGGSRYNDVTTLNAGIGYWLIVNNPSISSLSFDNVSKVAINGESFSVSIRNGWNQIGNPFLEQINWAEVLAYNELKGNLDPNNISQLYVFINGNYTTTNFLDEYRGAFIKNDGSAATLEIPLSSISAGGRYTGEFAQPRDYILGESDWEIVMEISSNNLYNYGVAGFGEHINASNGPDKLDMATPMLFENNINITMEGLTLDGSSLARDIRDLGQNNVWIATVTSHLKSGEIMDLSFNGYADLESDESLVLFDLQNGKMMEINRNTTYSFAYQPNYKLKIIKGIDSFIDEHAQVDHMIAGDLFPNPSNGIFSFDILLPKVEDVSIIVTVSDLTGRIVAEKQHQSMESGLNSLEIDLRELNLSSGLYLFDIQMVDKYSHNVGNKITKKGYLISK